MTKSWSVEINGEQYAIEYKAMFGVKVFVNGKVNKVRSQSIAINLIDHPLPIPGADVRIVAVGNDVDLAVNGVYQGSGKAYEPLEKLPGMLKPLMAISTFAGLILSGVIGVLVGVGFSMIYVKLAMAGKKDKIVPAFIGWVILEVVLMAVPFFLLV